MSDQVEVETNPIPAPPAYNSLNLLSQIKIAKEDSKHPAHFVESSFAICCGSVLVTIALGFSLALPTVKQLQILFKNK
jgi:hypothetical protein